MNNIFLYFPTKEYLLLINSQQRKQFRCVRGAHTLVLKPDFAKVFDSINWGNLRRILLVRGPPLWCDWMGANFHSSKSAVLLNDITGRWINCKRRLRQGDPLSCGKVKQDGMFQYPLVDGLPPLAL
jgi:hypothetical protein